MINYIRYFMGNLLAAGVFTLIVMGIFAVYIGICSFAAWYAYHITGSDVIALVVFIFFALWGAGTMAITLGYSKEAPWEDD